MLRTAPQQVAALVAGGRLGEDEKGFLQLLLRPSMLSALVLEKAPKIGV
jgi:hypothetical protein